MEVIKLVDVAKLSVEGLYDNMMTSIHETAETCIPKFLISQRRALWEDDGVAEKRNELKKALLEGPLTQQKENIWEFEEAKKSLEPPYTLSRERCERKD